MFDVARSRRRSFRCATARIKVGKGGRGSGVGEVEGGIPSKKKVMNSYCTCLLLHSFFVISFLFTNVTWFSSGTRLLRGTSDRWRG